MSLRGRRMMNSKKMKEVKKSPFKIEEFEKMAEQEEIKTPPSFIEEEKVIEPIVILEPKEVDERVICVNTNVIYDNIEKASEEMGVSANLIKKCCEGTYKTGGKDAEGNKLVWKFIRDL